MKLSRTIRTFDPDEVSSRAGGRPEVGPRDAGLRRRDLTAIWDGVLDLYRTGLYPAIALCLRRRGQVVLDRVGFILGSEHASIYGRHSERAFGHVGFTNVVMYADPERDLAVSLMTSGKPFLAPGVLRWLSLLQLIARLVPRRVMGNSRLSA